VLNIHSDPSASGHCHFHHVQKHNPLDTFRMLCVLDFNCNFRWLAIPRPNSVDDQAGDNFCARLGNRR